MTYKEMLLNVDRLAALSGSQLVEAEMPSYLANDPLLKSRLYSMTKDPAGLQFIRKHQLWPDAEKSGGIRAVFEFAAALP